MALVGLRLENFKCFEDTGEMRLAPLTLIFGKNNAGKSSILQSLLLLRQTVDAPEGGLRLNLSGPLYHVGAFHEIVHQHDAQSRICFALSLRQEDSGVAKVTLEFVSARVGPPPAGLLRVELPGEPHLEFRRGRGAGGSYVLAIGGREHGGEEAAGFRISRGDFFPLIGGEVRKRGRPSEARQRVREKASAVLSTLERILGSMRTVGPFRRPPERQYVYAGSSLARPDPAGERVVDALIEDELRRRGKKVRRRELLGSVNRWLAQIGRVRLEPVRRIGRSNIFELRLRDEESGQWASFADVGYGIGQAFSVIIEGLRTPSGGTFLVQEPEIHLHPDAQLAMADFLVYLAENDRQVIVETHSEAILLRIRRRTLAAGRRRLERKKVSVIQVAREERGLARVRQLKLDELSQVSGWPRGFMEEAVEERLALLEAAAKSAEGSR
jgi:predicted ATPase